MVEEHAEGRIAVTTCPPRLLQVVIHRLCHGIMNNKSHVWLIDTHTECDSANEDLHFPGHPKLLALGFLLGWEAGVEWSSELMTCYVLRLLPILRLV